jgi:asparagine synthase (glutamine-hydrolysing)
VGFGDAAFDERSAAAATARQLGLPHTAVLADDLALGRALETLGRHMAEPLADPALLPTYLLAETARREVTVVLGGEGADELFGGYPTYRAHRLVKHWSRVPRPLRRALRGALAAWPSSHGRVTPGYLLRRFVAGADLPWPERHHAWFGTGLPSDIGPRGATLAAEDPGPDIVRASRLLDFQTYLRDDLLVKLDRATMRVGLEARAPYLDRGVASFALRLEASQVLRGTTGKWLLREAASMWLPRDVVRRTKRGLSVPVSGWINGGLAGEVDRLLGPTRLRRQGVLGHLSVARLLAEHRARKADHGRALWALIMLQLWLERFGGGPE